MQGAEFTFVAVRSIEIINDVGFNAVEVDVREGCCSARLESGIFNVPTSGGQTDDLPRMLLSSHESFHPSTADKAQLGSRIPERSLPFVSCTSLKWRGVG